MLENCCPKEVVWAGNINECKKDLNKFTDNRFIMVIKSK